MKEQLPNWFFYFTAICSLGMIGSFSIGIILMSIDTLKKERKKDIND